MAQELSKFTEFFLQPNYLTDIENDALLYGRSLPQLELDVQGYGSFHEIELQDRFVQTFEEYMKVFSEIKFLKIQVAGFQQARLEPNGTTLVSRICRVIMNYRSITRLHLNFPNFMQGTLDDFRSIIQLVFQSELKLEEMQLNLANWRLNLDLATIENCLRPVLESVNFVHFDSFRLELSGWYYQNHQALFGGEPQRAQLLSEAEKKEQGKELARRQKDNVNRLHQTIRGLVQALFRLTKEVLTLDFRKYLNGLFSWHEALEMKTLKKGVDNLTKAGSYEKSLVQHNSKPFEDNTKQFKFTFLV